MKIHIGTSGYNYRHWRNGVFYPKGLSQAKQLDYYSQHFTTVEINATFYGSFQKNVFEKWCKQTPDEFTFSLKGPRYITHIKRLNQVDDSIGRFYKEAIGLGRKLETALWQFPKNFTFNDINLKRLGNFLKQQPKEIKQAIELRNDSWFNKSVYKLMEKAGCAIVINSSRSLPEADRLTADFAYLRFHGPQSLYSSNYSDSELKEWAEKIKRFRVKNCYCYFNNDSKGFAVKNALALRTLLS